MVRRSTLVSWVLLGLSVILLLFVSLRLTHPADLSRRLMEHNPDTYEFFSSLTIMGRHLREGRWPFSFTHALRYPVGFDFGAGFDGVFGLLIGSILGLVLPLILAYNITAFVIALTNVYLSAYFFRKMAHALHPSEKRNLQVLRSCMAGLFFGLSPYVMARLSAQFNLAFVGGFAALAWAITACYVWRARSSVSAPVVLRAFVLSFVLLWLGSLQYLALALIFALPLIVFVRFAHVRRFVTELRAQRAAWHTSLLAVAGSLTLFVLLFHRYILALLQGTMHYKLIPHRLPPASINLIVPHAVYGEMWGGFRGLWNNGIFLGVSAVVIWIVFLCSRDAKRWKIGALLLAAYLFSFLFSIVSFPLLMPYVIHYGETGRFVLGVLLLTACLLTLSKSFSANTVLLPLLFLLFAERMVLAIHVGPPLPVSFLTSVRPLPGEGILVVPAGEPFSDIVPYFTGKSVVDGTFRYNADTPTSRQFLRELPISLFQCDAKQTSEQYDRALDTLLKKDVRVILMNEEKCPSVRAALLSTHRLQQVRTQEPWSLYGITADAE